MSKWRVEQMTEERRTRMQAENCDEVLRTHFRHPSGFLLLGCYDEHASTVHVRLKRCRIDISWHFIRTKDLRIAKCMYCLGIDTPLLQFYQACLRRLRADRR